MMKFIEFDSEKCDECFKCLRACPTKAISFTKHNRSIINDLCIKCGICQMQCKTGALTIHLDLETVQNQVKTGKKTAVSLAPSFVGAFKMNHPNQMAFALKKLGFDIIEETARGAEIVSEEYETYIDKSGCKNIITSCCPSTNTLIEHKYSQAIPSVIPVVSPMIAHGFDIKDRHGSETFVVFIGPCLAKKAEAISYTNSIDAVITFKELEKWFQTASITLEKMPISDFDTPTTSRGKAYPIGGSLWKQDLKTRISTHYAHINVNGIEACTEFLKGVSNGEISGFCAELNICQGSCINGPDMPESAPSLYKRIELISEYVDHTQKKSENRPQISDPFSVNKDFLRHTFSSKVVSFPQIDEGQISEILLEMGKYTKQDQLDCGACGYSSCYEKAIAVSRGHSDIHLCMALLRRKAEGMQSTIFETSPNAICILDENMRILEVNPSFNRLFNATKIKLLHWPVSALIDHQIIQDIKDATETRISKKITLDAIDRTFFANIMRLFEGKHYIGIFTDITEVEKKRQELERVKQETLLTCQEVIDHQMQVAQEIASLLGETTAETKLGLNKLKSLVLSDGGAYE
jgi:PAS domain S-box-containing protein